MKKVVFDLTYEEGRKMNTELSQTSYFKQYTKIYVASLMMIILMGGGLIFAFYTEEPPETNFYIIIPIIIIIGFVSLFTLLFWFKRLDLIKKYYETKIEK